MPEVADVHVVQALTNVAIGYPNDGFLSPGLVADVPVLKQSDKFFIFDVAHRGDAPEHDLRSPGAEAAEADFDMTDDTYSCEGHALRKIIPDEERANSDPPIQPEINAVNFLVKKLLVAQDIDLKAKLDASITGDYTSDPGDEWDDETNGDPFADINLAINTIEDGCGLTPNVMGMDGKVWRALQKHPDILERVLQGGSNENPAQASQNAVAGLFGLDKILVGSPMKTTSTLGATVVRSRIWGTDVYVAYVPLSPALREPALAYRFTWKPFSGGENGFAVSKARAAGPSRRADEITAEKYYHQMVTCTTAGYRLQNRID